MPGEHHCSAGGSRRASTAHEFIGCPEFGGNKNGKRSRRPLRWLSGLSMQSCDQSDIILGEPEPTSGSNGSSGDPPKAIRNLDAIPAACGKHIDSVWLGGLDCRVSMELPGFGAKKPEVGDSDGYARINSSKALTSLIRDWLLGDDDWLKTRRRRQIIDVHVHLDLDAVLQTRNELANARRLFPKKDYSSIQEFEK